jgi:glutamate N-acetyltransferase/amino-acid N-acetyltransferase
VSVTRPLGFRAAAGIAGLKPSGRPDLALILRDAPPPGAIAGAAACFTKNAIVGAPVTIGLEQRRRFLAGQSGPPRAILINAGNSNAATGEPGLAAARACMAEVARHLNCTPDEVLPSSTGVIGRVLPVDRITRAIPALVASASRGESADAAAAAAIMTTDLVPKHAARDLVITGHPVRLGAIAKGSGMIAPRLDSAAQPPTPAATMLAFITTDAPIASRDLQAALDAAARATFNRISVDNHASCSDTIVALASGAAGLNAPITPGTPAHQAFAAALHDLCLDLATQVVTDGEGATRTFTVTVRGTATDDHAEAMAREVVNSPLVKCAIHGRDPNWGRIVTAAGNAGIPFDAALASLTIGSGAHAVEVYRAGLPVSAALTDPRLKAAMSAKHIDCLLIVGPGPGHAWMTGCDLSANYVSINADYTT